MIGVEIGDHHVSGIGVDQVVGPRTKQPSTLIESDGNAAMKAIGDHQIGPTIPIQIAERHALGIVARQVAYRGSKAQGAHPSHCRRNGSCPYHLPPPLQPKSSGESSSASAASNTQTGRKECADDVLAEKRGLSHTVIASVRSVHEDRQAIRPPVPIGIRLPGYDNIRSSIAVEVPYRD